MKKFTHNPLKNCKLRTAGLSSVNGARFGMTRNGGKRAHQGIDLASDEGYRCYAVEDGEIVGINKGFDNYGFTVSMRINNPLKPELNGKFAFYAHLDRIDVNIGQLVKAGTQIGLTGDTGNAKGMTTENKGGHLHFEIRTIQNPGLGLCGRINPEPFIKF
ncbi:MAG: M23 family metallopeptidase [Cloacibacterium sp.]|nr:M23 family metallopeptidase [Cloacibacterium sp.]